MANGSNNLDGYFGRFRTSTCPFRGQRVLICLPRLSLTPTSSWEAISVRASGALRWDDAGGGRGGAGVAGFGRGWVVGVGDLVRLVEGVEEEERINDLKEAFKMYENDGCGCITPKSLKRMLSRLGESRSIDECTVMISQFDLNGDGVLNFDEFKVMML
ncbi:putative calcium-binding protein CML40 [Vitis vinifera]|uniref:Putative calcium-binding protein CML40 n=1 Tax=Vitis vinifera TaxID=29760 RepID=A0A438BT23_VITVI|nr:putative calcium-binding protein CML40 [Vitis vinifera]